MPLSTIFQLYRGKKNEAKVTWIYRDVYVPSIVNMWTKYAKPRLYGNGETDFITKT